MKKTILLFVFSLLLSVTGIQAQDWLWTQVGFDFTGLVHNQFSGSTVSLSTNGLVVAFKYHLKVRVFQNNSGNWSQIGSDIEMNAESISLNADGSMVAIGTGSGLVRIYQNNAGTWTQVGGNILSNVFDFEGDFGSSVSLSADGSIVAIGALDYIGAEPYTSVYQLINGNWIQMGSNIDLDPESISLSADGSILAIGGDGVQVFQNSGGTWTQIGSTINFGAKSVSLSADGSIVAIGGENNMVKVYQNNSGTWTQTGQDINGGPTNDDFGFSVSINTDGSVVAVGAPENDNNGTDAGLVRIYKNYSGTWTQIGQDLMGDAAEDRFGWSVSLSGNGATVAIGAPWNDNGGTNAGLVKVFENTTLDITELKDSDINIYPNPSNGVFTIENANDYEINITDITGKIVYHANQAKNMINRHIRLQQSGVYIVNFKSDTKSFSSKIVVR